VARALAYLQQMERAAVKARYRPGCPPRSLEIAHEFGVSRAAVNLVVKCATKKMARMPGVLRPA
jgi:hypothetical protein